MVVGRFAPSPTGPLHLGSLVAAMASYCDAKNRHGLWLVRIEDVDTTRCDARLTKTILDTLQDYGLAWDGEVVLQSQRTAYYEDALNQLKQGGLAFPCTCSRKEIADSSSQHGIEGLIYPGTCLQHPLKPNTPVAWRFNTRDTLVTVEDRIAGIQQHQMARDIGDFVIKRADGLFSYQLAVVVDDALQGITDVVRGADLLHSTTRQCSLQQALGYPRPRYAHVPLVLNADGQKLSKQTMATALPPDNILTTLTHAAGLLPFFNAPVPSGLDIARFWRWAISHWQLA